MEYILPDGAALGAVQPLHIIYTSVSSTRTTAFQLPDAIYLVIFDFAGTVFTDVLEDISSEFLRIILTAGQQVGRDWSHEPAMREQQVSWTRTYFEVVWTSRETYTGTALHVAADSGHPQCLRVMLKLAGQEASQLLAERGGRDDTPLHLAARSDREECLRVMLSSVDPATAVQLLEMQDAVGHTPLHSAAWANGSECLGVMLEKAGREAVRLLGSTDRIGDTPLHTAAIGGYIDCLRVMMDAAGAEAARLLANRDGVGYTPLRRAAKQGNKECLALLLRAAGDRAARLLGERDSIDYSAMVETFNKRRRRINTADPAALPSAASLLSTPKARAALKPVSFTKVERPSPRPPATANHQPTTPKGDPPALPISWADRQNQKRTE